MLSALKELDQLYREIEGELLGRLASTARDEAAITDAIDSSRQLIARLEQVNQRFSGSASQWLEQKERTSGEEREQVRRLAQDIRLRASSLLENCQDCSARLEAVLSRLQKELGRVRDGSRFLQSSKPARINYPKFIDSRG